MSNTIGNDNTMRPDEDGDQHKQSLDPGDTLGQYKIIRLLGRGGMGEVYEVEHTTLEKRFALKLLPKDFGQNKNALERFRREAKVMANLEHPNILNVDDFGETDGRYWLRMELIDTLTAEDENTGKRCDVGSLQELADFCDGKIPEDVLLPIIEQILKGLSYAHEKGAIHRDLKPGNILLQSNTQNQDGSPIAKIADFGLVRVVGEEWMRSQAQRSVSQSMSLGDQATEVPGGGTSTKALLGTYEYMSPEQKNGEEATVASDVYALGVLMYRLLTGSSQLGRKSVSQINPELSGEWDALIDKAVEESPEERFVNGTEFLGALQDIKSGGQAYVSGEKESVASAGESPPPTDQEKRGEKSPDREQSHSSSASKSKWVIAVLCVLVCALAGLWGILQLQESNESSSGKAATDEHDDAIEQAQAVTAYRQVRENYEEKLADNESLLEEHGGDKWAEVRKKARTGSASADVPLDGRKAYEQAMEMLPEAVQEAKKNKTRSQLKNAIAEAEAAKERGDWEEVKKEAQASLSILEGESPLEANTAGIIDHLENLASEAEDKLEEDTVQDIIKVGTYDAQSVFQQYPERKNMMQDMQKLQSDMQKAEQNKNQKKVQDLQQEMRKKQQEYIDKFEGDIDDAVPKLAEEKGIDIVVQEVTYTAEDIEKVDLTSDIIEALSDDPDADVEKPIMRGEDTAQDIIKVGTYDAQSVFQQYPERKNMMQDMQKLQSDMQKAEQNKNQKKVQDLQQEMRQKQQEYIDKFEGDIDDAVPKLAEEKGIDIVVQEVTYTAEDIEKVDLTSDIIEALGGAPDAGPQMPMMPSQE